MSKRKSRRLRKERDKARKKFDVAREEKLGNKGARAICSLIYTLHNACLEAIKVKNRAAYDGFYKGSNRSNTNTVKNVLECAIKEGILPSAMLIKDFHRLIKLMDEVPHPPCGRRCCFHEDNKSILADWLAEQKENKKQQKLVKKNSQTLKKNSQTLEKNGQNLERMCKILEDLPNTVQAQQSHLMLQLLTIS